MKTNAAVPKQHLTRPLFLLVATVLVVPFHLVLAPAACAQSVVTTLAATSVSQTNATLNGTVNPNGAATTVYFQYGLTTNYGYLGGYTLLPATNATLTLPGVLASLPGAAGATWTQSSAPPNYWSAIASSADGTRLAA